MGTLRRAMAAGSIGGAKTPFHTTTQQEDGTVRVSMATRLTLEDLTALVWSALWDSSTEDIKKCLKDARYVRQLALEMLLCEGTEDMELQRLGLAQVERDRVQRPRLALVRARVAQLFANGLPAPRSGAGR
ncbi:hypothetical protein [Amycolatopsis sp. NPDC050768]|uniref:hypothetical protein n=1 Tax=Amycolatopsis sp. NPDC050768 TaxID=3154839 RepID=UPI0033D4A2D0